MWVENGRKFSGLQESQTRLVVAENPGFADRVRAASWSAPAAGNDDGACKPSPDSFLVTVTATPQHSVPISSTTSGSKFGDKGIHHEEIRTWNACCGYYDGVGVRS
jgi:hypothetical protein